MTRKIHSIVEDSRDFDRHFRHHPIDQEVTATLALSSGVERAKA